MKKISQDTFVERLINIYGDKYDYSQVRYQDARTKVLIKSSELGDWWCIPGNLLRNISHPKEKSRKISETRKTTVEHLLNQLKNFSFYDEFVKSPIYNTVRKKGLLKQAQSIIPIRDSSRGNITRTIYCYEFEDRSAYIGLTYNLEIRHLKRFLSNSDPVNRHYKTGINYVLKQLTPYTSVQEAQINERYFIEKSKINY